MKNLVPKTNAARILESLNIDFKLSTYEIDVDAQLDTEISDEIDLNSDLVYKTLVLKGNKDPFLVAIIPIISTLDLKKFAKATGNKNCEMLPLKDLLNTTGYMRGGCSPIGMKKQFPTFVEEAAILEDTIYVSAGKIGVQIELNPTDLVKVEDGEFADIIV